MVLARNAFISTIGFGSIKSYTNCRTFQEEPPTMWAQLSFQASCKRTQHCWSTTPDINGCCMLRLFANPVVRCCMLRVVAQSLKPVKLLNQQLPTFLLFHWSPKRSATMIDSSAELFPFSTPVLTGAYASDSARKLSETLRRRSQNCDQIWPVDFT